MNMENANGANAGEVTSEKKESQQEQIEEKKSKSEQLAEMLSSLLSPDNIEQLQIFGDKMEEMYKRTIITYEMVRDIYIKEFGVERLKKLLKR